MAKLNYHHLQYFWQVAKTGNLTQAAKQIHVSQSALSSQIKQLEHTMGVALFYREGRNLVLTEAGKKAFVMASDIFAKGEELEALLLKGADSVHKIRIGTLYTMSRNFIESFIEPLIMRKDICYSLHARRQASLLTDIYNHHIDIGLTNIEVIGAESDLIQSHLLSRQQVSIIGPYGLPLSAHGITQDYQALPWVLPTQGLPIRSAFDSYCSQYHFNPKVVAEADDMAMLRLLARDTRALTVLPAVVVKDELNSKQLQEYLALPNVYENFYALTIKRQFGPAIINELINHALDV